MKNALTRSSLDAASARGAPTAMMLRESLSSIAQRYQVSQDDLMALNGITDPNAVFLGQVLELPAGAVLPADPTATSLVAPTAAP